MANGNVLGIGIDLVEIVRMGELLDRWGDKLKDKVFLAKEREYCEAKSTPSRHYAGRFAVKEAVSKAFGTGLGPRIGLLDIEVTKNSRTGAPSVKLSGKARKLASERGVGQALISLSHTKDYALAQALLLKKKKNHSAGKGRRATRSARGAAGNQKKILSQSPAFAGLRRGTR